MRIGLGAPTEGVRGTGARAVVNLLKSDPWLSNRPDGRPGERIVTNWSWDTAGTTLHLKLRRDVYFHDGVLLTPEIAAQALRKAAAAKETVNFNSVTSVTPTEDGVDILLKERNGFLLTDLSGVTVLKPDNENVGTGPFKVVRVDDQGGELVAFPQYYRGRPALAGMTVSNYPTQRNAWAALMRGELDMLYEVSRDAVIFVEKETTVKAYSFPRPYYIPLVFNVRHPVLKNPEVRRAINEALDREALVRDGMAGRGRPADGPIWPLHWAYSPPTTPFAFNSSAAKLRLDKVVPPANAKSAPGSRITFTCLVFAQDPRFERLAALVQKQLADVGVDMKLEPVAQKKLVERLREGNFDAYLFEMAGRSLPWVYEFWRSREGGSNNSGYRSADAVLDKIRAALTEEEVRTGVAELQQVLHDDPPAAFLAWQATSRAVSTKFDVVQEKDRDILVNLWQWHLADPKVQAAR